MGDSFEYSQVNFLWPQEYKWEDESSRELDILLRRKWEEARDRGYFRYKLDKLQTKSIPGKHKFIAQLNVKRAQERRKPQDIQKISQPYCPESFNFTKIKKEEVLFELIPSWQSKKNDEKNLVIINVSPLEYCNSLLVPSVNSQLPQLLTKDGLKLATELVLLSGTRNLKIGFNSLCANASVNHHHFHLYYLKETLPVENISVEHLSGNCYITGSDWPAEGFAFELKEGNITDLVEDVSKLADYLVKNDISHNLMITRGSSFGTNSSVNCNALRIFLWARESSLGVKNDYAFNIACCELSGHLLLYTPEAYDNLDEEAVSNIMYNTCHDIFSRIKPQISNLFN